MIKSQEVKIRKNIKCHMCGKVCKNDFLLCIKCIKDPFMVEDLRRLLASKKDYALLKTTYSSYYSEIKNINTREFWNTKFNVELAFNQQDKMTREKIDNIISMLPERRIKLLDIAIGQGYLEDRLKTRKNMLDLFGIDISSIAISRAKQKYNGEFIVGDVFDIGEEYGENKFDVVVALELIEHLPPSKILSFYKLVRQILKNNGVLIISTPLNEGLRYHKTNPSGHIRDYSTEIVKAELEISNLKVTEVKQLYAFKSFYFLKKILVKIFTKKWLPNNIIIKALKVSDG